uniref:Uncharacterized protein n=1 Tax=Magallana gigas TaxID=29159 RepID=A0A8W8KLW7_MAGGI
MTRPPLFILVAVVTSHFPRLSGALGFPKCNSNHLRINQIAVLVPDSGKYYQKLKCLHIRPNLFVTNEVKNLQPKDGNAEYCGCDCTRYLENGAEENIEAIMS